MNGQNFELGNLEIGEQGVIFFGEKTTVILGEIDETITAQDGVGRITIHDEKLYDFKWIKPVGNIEIMLSFRLSELLNGTVDLRIEKDRYFNLTPQLCKDVRDYDGSNACIFRSDENETGLEKAVKVYLQLVPQIEALNKPELEKNNQ